MARIGFACVASLLCLPWPRKIIYLERTTKHRSVRSATKVEFLPIPNLRIPIMVQRETCHESSLCASYFISRSLSTCPSGALRTLGFPPATPRGLQQKTGRLGRAGAGGCCGSGRLPPQLSRLRLATIRAGRHREGARRGRGRAAAAAEGGDRRGERAAQPGSACGERGESGGGRGSDSPWSRSQRPSGVRRRRQREVGRRAQ